MLMGASFLKLSSSESVAKLSEGREDQAKAYEQARSDARAFFDGLDEEEEKRAGQ